MAMHKYICLFYFIFSTKPLCYAQVFAGVCLQYRYRLERMEKMVEFARS